MPEFLDLVQYFILTGEYPEIADPPSDTTPTLVIDDKVIPPPKWMGWKDTSSSQEDMLAAWEARSR